MENYTTSLVSLLNRAVAAVSESIAKDGLKALKQTVDDAGFGDSPYLKNYEVFSYVEKDLITFEIVLNLEAVETSPESLKDDISEAQEAIGDSLTKVFRLTNRGVEKVNRMKDIRFDKHDARRPARDARTPPKRVAGGKDETRTKSSDRSIGHALARSAPRKMQMTRGGKVSLSFGLQTEPTGGGGVKFPKGDFQGIIGQFMDKLKQVVSSNFVPELEQIIARHTNVQ